MPTLPRPRCRGFFDSVPFGISYGIYRLLKYRSEMHEGSSINSMSVSPVHLLRQCHDRSNELSILRRGSIGERCWNRWRE